MSILNKNQDMYVQKYRNKPVSFVLIPVSKHAYQQFRGNFIFFLFFNLFYNYEFIKILPSLGKMGN